MPTDYTYIESAESLKKCVAEIKSSSSLALDLEFDKNRYAYGFNLSMIQISDSKSIFLIDALQLDDLSEIFALFEDESIQKIVFAFGEDIRLLHSVGCFPKNVSDLSIAASLLDFSPCSLSSLTYKVLEVEEKESSQKSNWLKRPLTQAQLDYAAEDVKYLHEIQINLEERLIEKGVEEWFEEENSKYSTSDYSEIQSFSPIKNKEKKDLTEYQLYLLEELINLRESIAEKTNKPGYHIISKDILLRMAKGELLLRDMFSEKGISKYFKNSEAKKAIHDILSDSKIKSEKLGLSLSDPAIKRLEKEEYQEMVIRKKKSDKIISSILMPIKEDLKLSQGENIASFIFSNKIMNDISRGQLPNQLPYKQKLIWETAKKLELDLAILS